MEHDHVPRARNPFFYKNGPWVHITVEYATSTANFCPLSLSNSFLTGLHDKTACLAEKSGEKTASIGKFGCCLVILVARHTR